MHLHIRGHTHTHTHTHTHAHGHTHTHTHTHTDTGGAHTHTHTHTHTHAVTEVLKKSREAYQSAVDLAKIDMAPTHPIRLGLALNFSVFFYEILNDDNEACKLAKKVRTERERGGFLGWEPQLVAHVKFWR